MIRISQNFDGGNIIVKSVKKAKATINISLDIRKDSNSDFYQWFYYRLTGARGKNCVMSIDNAKGAAYIGGWKNYQARASYDGKDWFLVPTRYKNGKLLISHTPDCDSVFYAYFAPYSMQDHADLVNSCQMYNNVSLKVLGRTLDGQDMDLLKIGKSGKGKKKIWLIARQHPGEIMAEWWMEGFLARLLDNDDPTARILRQKCVFYVVPNMNPDGSKRGNLRTNAAGANLNREWGIATKARSPEVYLVEREMRKTGVDFNLDVHGDEALPYNFIAGAEGIKGYTKKQARLLKDFCEAYKKFSPDFQTKYGYKKDKPGTANMTMATNYIAKTHNCLAMTLEMPFKDNADLPDKIHGWSPERASLLGRDVLGAVLAVVDDL